MRTEKIKKESAIFITDDGKQFRRQDEALLHERGLELEEGVEKLKHV